MVLWGGIMRAVRGAGAVIALQELGLARAFDVVYTVSAGFPVASYLLAEQTRLGISLFYKELINPEFLNRWRFWMGMDVPYLISAMRDKKRLDVQAILQARTRLYTRVVNVRTGALTYLEVHEVGRDEFWQAMHAAVSVPILHRYPARVNGMEYIDTNIGGRLKEHTRYVLSTDNTDLLIIYNAASQRRVGIGESPRVCEICPPKNWKLSRFEKNPEILRAAGQQVADLVWEAFGEKEKILI